METFFFFTFTHQWTGCTSSRDQFTSMWQVETFHSTSMVQRHHTAHFNVSRVILTFWICSSSVTSPVTILSQKSFIRVHSRTYGPCLWTTTHCLCLLMITAATAVVTTELAAANRVSRDKILLMCFIQFVCQNFRNTAFILRASLTGTQLLGWTHTGTSWMHWYYTIACLARSWDTAGSLLQLQLCSTSTLAHSQKGTCKEQNREKTIQKVFWIPSRSLRLGFPSKMFSCTQN